MEYIHPEAAFTAHETEALAPDDAPNSNNELDDNDGPGATNANERSDGERSDSERYTDDSDPREALGHLKNAARRNPASARHLAELAEGYAAADLPHQALRQYQRALQTGRDAGEEEMPDTHLGIGDLCRTFAMSAVAVRSYERAVRLRPRRPYYRWKLGVALAALGLYEQAVNQLQTAIELAPKDTYYRFQLADVFLLMGREEQAIDALETVVALAPRDDYYRLRLGAALLRAERTGEAVTHFERAVQLQPKNPSHRTLLRYAYTRNGQEPAIAVDIDMLELGAYDEDFVRRIQRLAQPVA
jgi:tetratricopeptide (TPR) repeat protein